MDKQQAEELLSRYRKGLCTAEEQAAVEAWVDEELQLGSWDKSESEKAALGVQLKERIDTERLTKDKTKVVKLWPQLAPDRLRRIAAVAAVLACIVLGVYFFNVSRDSETTTSLLANDIAPGKNGATITLANGKVIQLSDAKTGVVVGSESIKYNDGSSLSPQGGSLPGGERNDVMLTASTAQGQTYQFTLPDGTKVWLNAASSLKFPSAFESNDRIVELEGEGYFEVATSYMSLRGRKTKQSFIVKNRDQQVEVLGTHFNINAYADEGSTKTTLLEGSVLVSARSGPDRSFLLKPNEQLARRGKAFSILKVNASDEIAWIKGKFIFDEEPLESILRKISRWYDIRVIYHDDAARQVAFGGTMSRFTNVSKVLGKLEATGDVRFDLKKSGTEYQLIVYKK